MTTQPPAGARKRGFRNRVPGPLSDPQKPQVVAYTTPLWRVDIGLHFHASEQRRFGRSIDPGSLPFFVLPRQTPEKVIDPNI